MNEPILFPRQTLNGRILQIDVMPENETNVLFVGVRSDYYICMNKFCGDRTEWDDEFNRLMSELYINNGRIIEENHT